MTKTGAAHPDCTTACVNAITPIAKCSHNCPDHGAAHRRPVVERTEEQVAASWKRLPVPMDEEPF